MREQARSHRCVLRKRNRSSWVDQSYPSKNGLSLTLKARMYSRQIDRVSYVVPSSTTLEVLAEGTVSS